MTDIKIDKKATDYLKEQLGGGSVSAITNTIDFYQAVAGKHLNSTKFKALLAEAGCDLTQTIGGGLDLCFGASYSDDRYTAVGLHSNSDVDTLRFFICWKQIDLTMPQGMTSDSTIGELLDAIADQVAENVIITGEDLTFDVHVECLGNIVYLYDGVGLADLNDLVACFE